MPSNSPQSVLIVGAGPVGLCCALAMTQASYRVTVVDSGVRGAGWASGGMLGAVYETLGRGPETMTRLAFESLALWDGVAATAGIHLHRNSLFLARNADEVATLEALALSKRNTLIFPHPNPSPPCGGEGLWNRESQIILRKTNVSAGLKAIAAWTCSADAALNPREALVALRRACQNWGVSFVLGQAQAVSQGIVTLTNGTSLQADLIIIATGQSGSTLAGSLPELFHINPVKGQMLAVARGPDVMLDHTIRAGRLYLLARGEQIVIGATTSPIDHDPDTLDPTAHHALHQEAVALWPALESAPIVESWSGFRPMTPDGLPMFGPSGTKGVYLATGTYRNGWLLAPAIARALVDMVGGDAKTDGDLQPFSPQRFPI
jgi:glycine oxidase